MIVLILQNVIRKILRRRPCQNFLPCVLCVTQWPGLPTGMSHRAACGLSHLPGHLPGRPPVHQTMNDDNRRPVG